MVAYAVRSTGLGLAQVGATPRYTIDDMRRDARASQARAATGAIEALVGSMRQRIHGGAIVELDGKPPCPAGPWADDASVGKSNELDPNHCLSYGGPYLSPMLELPIPCEEAHRLLWADIGDEALANLRILMASKPAPGTSGDDQFRWYKSVLSACTVIGLSLNINPRDLSVAMNPQPNDAKPFGKYEVFNRARSKQNEIHRSAQAQVGVKSVGAGQQPSDTSNQFIAFPVVCPTFVAVGDEFCRMESRRPYSGPMEQMGWNDERTYADGLYRRLLRCDAPSIFGFNGYRGLNVGQATIWRTTRTDYTRVVFSDVDPRAATGNDRWPERAPGFFGRGFAFPYAMMEANARTDSGLADRTTQANITRDPESRMRALFNATAADGSYVTRGYFRSRTYQVGGSLTAEEVGAMVGFLGFGLPPGAARMHSHWEQCWAPTARYYVDLAEAWGRAFLEMNFAERIGSALAGYCYRIKRIIKVFSERGYDVMAGTAETVDFLITAAQRIRMQTATSVASAYASVASALVSVVATLAPCCGWVGLIVALVVAIVIAMVVGFIELAQWNRSPREAFGEADWSLILDAFFLRTPPLDSGCAPNPEAGLDLMDRGFNEDRGYGAPFARMARGEPLFDQLRQQMGGDDAQKSGFPWKTLLLAGGAIAVLAVATRK